jgi:hypothetical protein
MRACLTVEGAVVTGLEILPPRAIVSRLGV